MNRKWAIGLGMCAISGLFGMLIVWWGASSYSDIRWAVPFGFQVIFGIVGISLMFTNYKQE
jgi:hypothetical protein